MNTFPRISLPVKAVRKALTILKSLIPNRLLLPILGNVVVETTPTDGTWIVANDREISCRIRLDSICEPSARILVNHRRFAELLKPTKAEDVVISSDDSGVCIGLDSASFRLSADDLDQYPVPPRFEAKSYRSFAADDIIRAIDRTIHATDPESTRYALGAILIEHITDSATRFVATDGRRIAFQEIGSWVGNETVESSKTHELIRRDKGATPALHIRAALLLRECCKSAPKDSVVDIGWCESESGFVIRVRGFAEITCRNLATVFPCWRSAWVDYSADQTTFDIESAELLAVAKIAESAFGGDSEGTPAVDFLAIPRGMDRSGVRAEATKNSGKVSLYSCDLPTGYVSGRIVNTTVATGFLRDVLEAIGKGAGKSKSERMQFRIPNRFGPVIITTESGFGSAVMPMRDDETPESQRKDLSPLGYVLWNRLFGITESEPAPAPEPAKIETPDVADALTVQSTLNRACGFVRFDKMVDAWFQASIDAETGLWTIIDADTMPTWKVDEYLCNREARIVDSPILATRVEFAPIASEPEPTVIIASEPEESPEEFERRIRRESRADIRADRDVYARRLADAKGRLERTRKDRQESQWDSLRDDIYRLRRQGKAFDHDEPERAECLADIRKLRDRWVSLPVNRIRIQEQAARAESRHRDKLALFGRQTPNERPYDGPTPIAPAVATPVKVKRVRTPEPAPTVTPRPEFSEPTPAPRPGFSGVDVIAPTVRTVRRIGERRVYVRSWMGWFAHNPDADGVYVRDNSGPMTTLEVSVEVQAGTMEVSPDVPTMKPGRPTETTRENVPTIDPAALAAFATIVLFHPEPSALWTVSTVDVEFGRTLIRSAGRSTPEAKAAERARRFDRTMSLSPIANRVRTLAPIGKPVDPTPAVAPTPRPEFSGLGIGIRGTVYGLEILGDTFRLAGPNGTYDVSPCSDPVKANHGYHCDCPDHERRHAGNPSKGCKHVNALREVGLIPTTTIAPDRGPDGKPETTLDSGRKAKAAALRAARANTTGNSKPAWLMTAKEHATLSASLKINSSGTGGASTYGMGRSSSEQGFKAIAERAADLRSRLSGGTTVVRMGQLYAGDQKDAVRAAILKGEPVPSGRMRRLGINPDRPLLASGRGTADRLAKAEEIRASRASGSPEVPYTPAPEFSGVATVETLPPVCGGSGEDAVAVHPWQAKGLGMAPFRFRTVIEHPSKALQEANPDAYNHAAGIGAQQRKSLGLEDTHTCHACYRDITVAYVIESADGKRFVVGCECVLKTDDTQLITRVEAAKRERNRKASRKRSELKREEQRIRAAEDAKIAADVNAPIIEALERHESGWASQAVRELRRKPAAKCSPRFLDVVGRMFCEVTGEPRERFLDIVGAAV